jgi:cytochrome o ubiquinol oxidase subunit 2
MAKKRKKSNLLTSTLGPIVVVLAGLTVLIAVLLPGNNVALFNTKGLIAGEELNLMILTVVVMLVIGVPAVFLFYFVAWKYRESNNKAKRDPNAGQSRFLNVSIWLAPATIALVLALIMWPATHTLEPQKLIASGADPLTVQVIAMRWKWLFIYPEQKIATVNYLQVPTDTPVVFELTADEAPMSAFWIPNLGGMLYAMTGHVNRLNLMAETPGQYPGSTAEINGPGFSGMKFTANATSKREFDSWVRYTAKSADALDSEAYEELLKPSEYNEQAYYSLTDKGLYAKVLIKYAGGGHNHLPAAHHGAEH